MQYFTNDKCGKFDMQGSERTGTRDGREAIKVRRKYKTGHSTKESSDAYPARPVPRARSRSYSLERDETRQTGDLRYWIQ